MIPWRRRPSYLAQPLTMRTTGPGWTFTAAGRGEAHGFGPSRVMWFPRIMLERASECPGQHGHGDGHGDVDRFRHRERHHAGDLLEGCQLVFGAGVRSTRRTSSPPWRGPHAKGRRRRSETGGKRQRGSDLDHVVGGSSMHRIACFPVLGMITNNHHLEVEKTDRRRSLVGV